MSDSLNVYDVVVETVVRKRTVVRVAAASYGVAEDEAVEFLRDFPKRTDWEEMETETRSTGAVFVPEETPGRNVVAFVAGNRPRKRKR